MKIPLRFVPLLAIAISAASCQSQNPQPRHIEHVVLVWLKDPGNSETRRRIIEATKTFKDIPGVISARAGRPVPSTQPSVDASFDVGIVVTFKDKASLRAYGPNPIHDKAAKEVIVPVMKSIKVYDIELE